MTKYIEANFGSTLQLARTRTSSAGPPDPPDPLHEVPCQGKTTGKKRVLVRALTRRKVVFWVSVNESLKSCLLLFLSKKPGLSSPLPLQLFPAINSESIQGYLKEKLSLF